MEFSLGDYEWRQAARRHVIVLVWLVPALAILALALLFLRGRIPPSTMWAFGVLILLLSVLLLFTTGLNRRLVRRAVVRLYADGNNRGLFGPCYLTISPLAIRRVTQMHDSLVKWPAVERIVESDAHAFFYISAVNAFVLPKRAFSSEADYRAFLAAARHYAAQAAPPEEEPCSRRTP